MYVYWKSGTSLRQPDLQRFSSVRSGLGRGVVKTGTALYLYPYSEQRAGALLFSLLLYKKLPQPQDECPSEWWLLK
jgi:hypothetical protein